MSSFEFVLRIFLACVFPPLGVIGLNGIGCGTFLLLLLLTCCFWIPGCIVSIYLVWKEYSSNSMIN